MSTKIIGHRGAAGLAPENSLSGIRSALEFGLDAIEFDVRRTGDGQLVVIHDPHTGRVARNRQKLWVHESTLAELQALRLRGGHRIPTLESILKLVGRKKPLVIDIKSSGVAEELVRLLDKYPKVPVSCSSRRLDELDTLHRMRPNIPIFVQSHFDPLEVIHNARRLQATGISLNMWLMNPLTYHLALQHDLEVAVYTINHPFLGFIFRKLYPGVAIFTNHPERFIKNQVEANL